MTILPTAMRIQDDIPLVLGRRTSPDIAVVREIREAVAKVMAVQDFECKRHELSEMPVEVAAKPAGGWIPWDGRAESGPKEAVEVRFACGATLRAGQIRTWSHADIHVSPGFRVVAWR